MENESEILTVITIRRRVAEDGTSSVTSQVGHGQYVNAHEVAMAIIMAEHAIGQMKDKFFGDIQEQLVQAQATTIKRKGPNLTDAQGNKISSED